jgi:hypothetical protein
MHKHLGDDGWTVVTFTLPTGAAASVVTLHGDFNGWDGDHHVLLPPDDDGPPQLSLRLPPGRYEFGGQNSVVVTALADDASLAG